MFHWYVINPYSGHENKVKTNLEHRIVSMNQQQRFRRVVVPTEQVIETIRCSRLAFTLFSCPE